MFRIMLQNNKPFFFLLYSSFSLSCMLYELENQDRIPTPPRPWLSFLSCQSNQFGTDLWDTISLGQICGTVSSGLVWPCGSS